MACSKYVNHFTLTPSDELHCKSLFDLVTLATELGIINNTTSLCGLDKSHLILLLRHYHANFSKPCAFSTDEDADDFIPEIENVESKKREVLRLLIEQMLRHLNGLKCTSKTLEEVCSLLKENDYQIIIIGDTTVGKSSIINLIIGMDLMPVQHMECSTTFCEIRYGPKIRMWVYEEEDKACDILDDDNCENLRDILKEKLMDRSADSGISKYKKVVIQIPAKNLQNGLCIIDSPGYGTNPKFDLMIKEKLNKCFASICLTSYKQDYSWIQIMRENQDNDCLALQNTIIVLTKWDTIQDINEKRRTMENLLTTFRNSKYPDTQIIKISTPEAWYLTMIADNVSDPDLDLLLHSVQDRRLKTMVQKLELCWKKVHTFLISAKSLIKLLQEFSDAETLQLKSILPQFEKQFVRSVMDSDNLFSDFYDAISKDYGINYSEMLADNLRRQFMVNKFGKLLFEENFFKPLIDFQKETFNRFFKIFDDHKLRHSIQSENALFVYPTFNENDMPKSDSPISFKDIVKLNILKGRRTNINPSFPNMNKNIDKEFNRLKHPDTLKTFINNAGKCCNDFIKNLQNLFLNNINATMTENPDGYCHKEKYFSGESRQLVFWLEDKSILDNWISLLESYERKYIINASYQIWEQAINLKDCDDRVLCESFEYKLREVVCSKFAISFLKLNACSQKKSIRKFRSANLEEVNCEAMFNEIQVWRQIKHPNIIQFLFVAKQCIINSKGSETINLFLHFDGDSIGGNLPVQTLRQFILNNYSRKFEDVASCNVFINAKSEQLMIIRQQMVSAVEYLHTQRATAFDLSLDTVIVVPNGTIKITNIKLVGSVINIASLWNIARTKHKDLQSQILAFRYFSPDILLHPHQTTFKSDFYSLGICFYDAWCFHDAYLEIVYNRDESVNNLTEFGNAIKRVKYPKLESIYPKGLYDGNSKSQKILEAWESMILMSVVKQYEEVKITQHAELTLKQLSAYPVISRSLDRCFKNHHSTCLFYNSCNSLPITASSMLNSDELNVTQHSDIVTTMSSGIQVTQSNSTCTSDFCELCCSNLSVSDCNNNNGWSMPANDFQALQDSGFENL